MESDHDSDFYDDEVYDDLGRPVVWSYYWVSLNHLVLLIIFHFSAVGLLHFFIPKKFNEQQRKTLVCYIIQIVATTVSLGLTIAAGWMCGKAPICVEISRDRLRLVAANAELLVDLYIFELIYRHLNWQLVLHHVSTMFLVGTIVVSVQVTLDPYFLILGSIFFLQANTEQFVFVALYLHRIKHCHAPKVLVGSAIQTMVFKLTSSAGAIALWIAKLIQPAVEHKSPVYVFFVCFFPFALLLLTISQGFGTMVLLRLAYGHPRNSQAESSPVDRTIDEANIQGSPSSSQCVMPSIISDFGPPSLSPSLAIDIPASRAGHLWDVVNDRTIDTG
mmetsp:Transcript_10398/g.17569  ORF Transcript_10398/g.17569 Transcript_10398/m.17569 type:complete len:332 (-) Transcript_10398:419-1414(-)